MSGAEQFTAAVPERSGPTDWRGGLERSGARRGRVGRSAGVAHAGWTAIPRPRFARARKIKGNLVDLSNRGKRGGLPRRAGLGASGKRRRVGVGRAGGVERSSSLLLIGE